MSRPGSQIRPTFVPGDDSLLDGTWHGPSPEDERRAARVVALRSSSHEDCRDLLQMLGLLTPDTSELGSYYTEPGSLT